MGPTITRVSSAAAALKRLGATSVVRMLPEPSSTMTSWTNVGRGPIRGWASASAHSATTINCSISRRLSGGNRSLWRDARPVSSARQSWMLGISKVRRRLT